MAAFVMAPCLGGLIEWPISALIPNRPAALIVGAAVGGITGFEVGRYLFHHLLRDFFAEEQELPE